MKPRQSIVILTLLTLVCAVESVVPQQQESSERKLFQATGNEASLTGTIMVSGKVPKPLLIDMSADPVCMQLNQTRTTEWIVNHGDKLQNVFVYVKGGPLESFQFTPPQADVTLRHEKCRYSPHVLGVQVGQRLLIANEDATIHNTHPTPKLNPESNQSQAGKSPPLIKTFSRAELLIPFKDNQHPWEKAYVGVLNHPFFAVSDEFGNYEIRGLPPGNYTLVIWHERLGDQEVEVRLGANESRTINFLMDGEKTRF